MTSGLPGGGILSTATDFEEWVAAQGPALLRLAFVLTGNPDDADDVVQEALARALPRWDRISTVEDPDAYVRRMVVNAHTSGWRKFRRRESPVNDVHDGVGTCDPTHDIDSRQAMWEACRRLPEQQRVAVVLRYYEDLSYAQIADLIGAREANARARVSRGLAKLRRIWEEQ